MKVKVYFWHWLIGLAVFGLLNLSVVQAAKPKDAPHLVYTTQVKHQVLQENLMYTGTLTAQRIFRLYTQEGGRVLELPFYTGDRVEKGALLLRLDDRRLQIALLKAKASLQQLQQDLRRLKNLAKNKLVADDELARADTAVTLAETDVRLLQVRLEEMRFSAPFAGILSARLAEPGDVISSNTHVLTVLDPTALLIEVPVAEQHLARLRAQQQVQVQIDALGTEAYTGRIVRIYPTLDAQTRQGTIAVQLAQLPTGARAGQFCRVRFELRREAALSIPFAALRRDHEGEFVLVLEADNKVRRQAVRSGAQLDQRIEILDGVEAGQTLISRGFLGLKPGQTVQPAGEE